MRGVKTDISNTKISPNSFACIMCTLDSAQQRIFHLHTETLLLLFVNSQMHNCLENEGVVMFHKNDQPALRIGHVATFFLWVCKMITSNLNEKYLNS